MERGARTHMELAIEAHHLGIRHQCPQRALCHGVGDVVHLMRGAIIRNQRPSGDVVHLIRGAIRRNQRPSGDAVHLRTAAISR